MFASVAPVLSLSTLGNMNSLDYISNKTRVRFQFAIFSNTNGNSWL